MASDDSAARSEKSRVHPSLVRAAAAVASGSLWFLACADFDIWPLAWFAFLPCLVALRRDTPKRAFWFAWLCGFVANAGGFYWITTLLMRFGHMHRAPSTLLFALMMAYQGVHFGVMALIIRWIHTRRPDLPMALVLPATMTGLEYAMPFIFPWYLSITQAWVVPVIQVADLGGPSAVTFLLLLSNGAIYDLTVARLDHKPLRWKPAAVAAGVIAAALVYGFVRMAQFDERWAEAPKTDVGIVQANIGIIEKGRAGLAEKHLKLHQDLSKKLVERGADLIVWPESSYPYFYYRDMNHHWPKGTRRRVMAGIDAPLISGVITYGSESKYPYNSALMFEPDGRIVGKFDKNYLLVFGEYIPFYDKLPQFKKWIPEASNFSRGTTVTTFPFGDFRLGPMMCYEDIIPSFGRRVGKLWPHMLVNITNDAWFGATSEPYEHLALAVYRAVELRTGLVRAVNTGVSVLVDANGRVLKQTRSVDPVITPGVPPDSLLGEMALIEGGHTVYTAVGDLFSILNLMAVGVLLVVARRAGTSKKAPRGRSRKRRKKKR